VKKLFATGLKLKVGDVGRNTVQCALDSEANIEISLNLSNILPPDLDSESKRGLFVDLNDGPGGHDVLDSFSGNSKGVESKGIEDKAGEADENGDNDSNRNHTSGHCFVLIIILVTQHLRRVEEVYLSHKFF